MNTAQISLLIAAVAAAVNNLDSHNHVLDSVTTTDEQSKEMNRHFRAENNAVVARLVAIVSKLRASLLDESTPLEFDQFELFSITKAVNERIVVLEKAMAYFSQMGPATQMIQDFQTQIRDIHFANFAVLDLNR